MRLRPRSGAAAILPLQYKPTMADQPYQAGWINHALLRIGARRERGE
jgi:hypothetical protein